MESMKKWVGMALMGLVLVLGVGSPALAQEDADEDGGVGPILTIQEKLGLSDAQVTSLKDLKGKAKAVLGPLVVKQVIDLAILKKKVEAKASDAELKPVLGRLVLRQAAIDSARGKFWGQALALLNPTQQSKVVLVMTALYLDALKTVRQSWRDRLMN